MNGYTIKVRINNETIRGKLEAAHIEDKVRETLLRWFDHAKNCKCNNVESDDLEVIGTSRRRGRFKRIWVETVG